MIPLTWFSIELQKRKYKSSTPSDCITRCTHDCMNMADVPLKLRFWGKNATAVRINFPFRRFPRNLFVLRTISLRLFTILRCRAGFS